MDEDYDTSPSYEDEAAYWCPAGGWDDPWRQSEFDSYGEFGDYGDLRTSGPITSRRPTAATMMVVLEAAVTEEDDKDSGGGAREAVAKVRAARGY